MRNTYEIDFFAIRDTKQYYIQVVSDMEDANAKVRETKPFYLLKDAIQRVIVVNKPVSEAIDQDGIIIIGAADFLLRFIKAI